MHAPSDEARPWSPASRWLCRYFALVTLAALAVGCARPGGASGPNAPTAGPAPASVAARPGAPLAVPAGPAGAPAAASPVPVEPDDAQWGDGAAPVTIVEFTDLECPFCARAQPALTELARRYGPHQIRIVLKHFPLPFHPHAELAARATRAMTELRGSDATFGYVAALFAEPDRLGPEDLDRAAVAFGVAPGALIALARTPRVAARVAADMALADRTGVQGTPHFLINGRHVSGAVPVADLALIVDLELAEAGRLRAKGVRPEDVYASRTLANFREPPPADAEPPPDTAAWRVPIGTSPVLGSPDALVTIIEFTDLQCPYCKRAQATLNQIQQSYGHDVRLVFKHLPLPFHPRARPAATLAIEARRKLGDAGFWKALDLLYASAPDLGDSSLANIALKLHLDWPRIHEAIARDADATVIAADDLLGRQFAVRGTPHFFINGHRLVGARPLEDFTSIIDAALAEARQLVKDRGIPPERVFDELMRSAAGPSAPLD
jgi:protein-disulfide isomerase